MNAQLGKNLWRGATVLIVVFTLSVVVRNIVHAVYLKREINELERDIKMWEARIAADSILLEQLRYDEYVEEYAREHFRMQRPGERVYILKRPR